MESLGRAFEEVRSLDTWSTYTPEGRRLLVRREGEAWVAALAVGCFG
jgi:hypothetical protein